MTEAGNVTHAVCVSCGRSYAASLRTYNPVRTTSRSPSTSRSDARRRLNAAFSNYIPCRKLSTLIVLLYPAETLFGLDGRTFFRDSTERLVPRCAQVSPGSVALPLNFPSHAGVDLLSSEYVPQHIGDRTRHLQSRLVPAAGWPCKEPSGMSPQDARFDHLDLSASFKFSIHAVWNLGRKIEHLGLVSRMFLTTY